MKKLRKGYLIDIITNNELITEYERAKALGKVVADVSYDDWVGDRLPVFPIARLMRLGAVSDDAT